MDDTSDPMCDQGRLEWMIVPTPLDYSVFLLRKTVDGPQEQVVVESSSALRCWGNLDSEMYPDNSVLDTAAKDRARRGKDKLSSRTEAGLFLG